VHQSIFSLAVVVLTTVLTAALAMMTMMTAVVASGLGVRRNDGSRENEKGD